MLPLHLREPSEGRFRNLHLSTDLREEDGLVLILDIGVNSHFQVILPQFLEADHGGSAKARSVKGKFHFHAAGRFFRRKGRLCCDRFPINFKGSPVSLFMSVPTTRYSTLFSALHTQPCSTIVTLSSGFAIWEPLSLSSAVVAISTLSLVSVPRSMVTESRYTSTSKVRRFRPSLALQRCSSMV